MDSLLQVFFTFLVRFYRGCISPFLPARCRFYPTCSTYALEALQLHGGFRGTVLTAKRICRCHPWGGSGVDFVPLPLYRYHFMFLPNLPNGFGVFVSYHNLRLT